MTTKREQHTPGPLYSLKHLYTLDHVQRIAAERGVIWNWPRIQRDDLAAAISSMTDDAPDLLAENERLRAALENVTTFHRVLFKHPGTAKHGTEWRRCRFCENAWMLGSRESHSIMCAGQAVRAALKRAKEGA